eukprot:jgi/Chlat1/5112/Chrsp33S08965
MKIRVRVGAGQTHRVEVPELCDLAQLKARIATVVFNSRREAASVRVSLNNRDELGQDDEGGLTSTPLQALGIRSGDLVFVLDGNSVQRSQLQQPEQLPSSSPSTSAPARPSASAADIRARCAAAAAARVSTAAATEHPPSTSAVQQPALAVTAAPQQAAIADETHELQGNDVQADMDIAEDEYVEHMDEQLELPPCPPVPAVPQVPSTLSAAYKAVKGDVRSGYQLLMVALHAVLVETGLQIEHSSGEAAQLPSGWTAASRYALKGTPAVCEVYGRALGDFLVVQAAVVGDDEIVRMSLRVADYVSDRAHADQRDAAAVFVNARGLWALVKDSLTLKLLSALHHKAGLFPPPGLIALPSEIKLQCLQQLDATSLAALSSTCRELRFVASDDKLWQTLFVSEFGSHGASRIRSHFKTAFAEAWQERQRQRRIWEQHRRQLSMYRPRMGRMPRMPLHPHPPFVIGGDYDRFPVIGDGVFLGSHGIGGVPSGQLSAFPDDGAFSPQGLRRPSPGAASAGPFGTLGGRRLSSTAPRRQGLGGSMSRF